MKNTRKYLYSMLTAGFLSARVFAASGEGAGGLADPGEFEAFLDSLFIPHMETAHIPGAVFAVAKDGALFFSKGYGYADLEEQRPVEPDKTAFYIGSIGKLFTTTAAMQLVDNGSLDLDADLNQYLDLFQLEATYPEPVTARHLLTHTGGFDEGVLGMLAPTAAAMLPLGRYLQEHMPPRVMPPGILISYSNNGMALAGYLVEVLGGMPYARYVERRVLQPLGMDRSRAELTPEIAGSLATGYQYDAGRATYRSMSLK